MALDKSTLQDDIKDMMTELLAFDGGPGEDQDASIDKFSQDLGDAIDTYVKTATVNVTSVSGVQSGGDNSGTGSGTLS